MNRARESCRYVGAGTADFTGVVAREDMAVNYYANAARHKAYVRVDEQGTEAAAGFTSEPPLLGLDIKDHQSPRLPPAVPRAAPIPSGRRVPCRDPQDRCDPRR